MKTNAELRAAARTQLGNNIFSETWLMGLVLGAIYMAVSALTSYMIGLVLIGPVSIAVANNYLSLSRGKATKIDIAELGFGFRGDTIVRYICLYLLQYVYIWLWSLLFVIPGIVKTYAYRLAPYIAIERPELSINDCITESRRLMDGHKMQAFLLDLSFLGWYLLGFAACCVGVVFVIPYHDAALANFYTSLVEKDEPIEVKAEDVTA